VRPAPREWSRGWPILHKGRQEKQTPNNALFFAGRTLMGALRRYLVLRDGLPGPSLGVQGRAKSRSRQPLTDTPAERTGFEGVGWAARKRLGGPRKARYIGRLTATEDVGSKTNSTPRTNQRPSPWP
jgi:hypothetical protein